MAIERNTFLEVLKDATPEDLDNAKDFLAEGKLTLTANGKGGVYVEATAYRGNDVGTAVIEHTHANITVVKKNGEVVYQAVPHCDGAVAGSAPYVAPPVGPMLGSGSAELPQCCTSNWRSHSATAVV